MSKSCETQLKALQQDYEDFTYIISHDFKAPIRHIKEFTRLLTDSLKPHMGDDETLYTQFIIKAVGKMEDMQTALLELSRVAAKKAPITLINTQDIVSNIIQSFTANNIIFETTQLPDIHGDTTQIEQLFTHLLDNAAKFHPPQSSITPKISISAHDDGQMWRFEISDNGIGIDDEYHDKVFRMFQNLHPDQYAGIGAGLTIAKKIAEHNNGNIYIKPNDTAHQTKSGTTICFTWPKRLHPSEH